MRLAISSQKIRVLGEQLLQVALGCLTLFAHLDQVRASPQVDPTSHKRGAPFRGLLFSSSVILSVTLTGVAGAGFEPATFGL